MYKSLHILFLAFLLISCGEVEEIDSRPKLALVGESTLYIEDVQDRMPKGLSEEDSINFINQYIENWIKEEVVMQQAEQQLPKEAKDVDRQLEDYRKSLLIFAYEQKFIEDRLDTVVSEQEIAEYYNNHPEDFMLRDFIVKALYGKFPINAPNIDEAKKLYKSTDENDLVKMEAFANNYAIKFEYSPEDWIYFDEILKVVPLEEDDVRSFIRKKKKVSFDDSTSVYFVNILDYKLKDAQSPLSFEREKIKGIILTLRTNKLRLQLQDDLYDDAVNSGKIQRFENDK